MKKNIKPVIAIIVILVFACITAGSANKGARIQVAILLDTSSSMDGLISQAKSQLWKIVNELSRAKKKGMAPQLEVALYEYGKSSLPGGEGYLRQIVPLSTDLDRVSEELFNLSTNGGDEFCGRVIQAATTGLSWSPSTRDLRIIFIAGNEPFSQGGVNYVKACKNAIAKGIIVNTIFCGRYQEGVATHWRDGAHIAEGKYMNIDQSRKAIQIKAPQDEDIIRLGREMNSTYIGYGKRGADFKKRQEKQDRNASGMSKGAIVERSVAKSGKQYRNSSWDIVDAVGDKRVKLENLKDDEVPEEMKKMNTKERKAYIKKMIKKRKRLQKRISKLNNERRKYVKQEMKKRSASNTLDAVVIPTVRKQAVEKNFKFK